VLLSGSGLIFWRRRYRRISHGLGASTSRPVGVDDNNYTYARQLRKTATQYDEGAEGDDSESK